MVRSLALTHIHRVDPTQTLGQMAMQAYYDMELEV